MSPDTHEGGYFIISRRLFTSDLWGMPPEYTKLWVYLIGRANHQDKRYSSFILKRGQCFCTYGELREQMSYHIGYRKKKPSVSQMKHMMKFLRKTQRIVSVKKPRGVLITLLNYDKYQNPESYERTKERTSESANSEPKKNRNALSINKNEKNEKNSNYQEKRKKLLKHIEKIRPNITSPDKWVSALESKTSVRAVSKALNDWNHTNFTLEQFWDRAIEHHSRLQGTNNKKPISFLADNADD